MKENLYKVIKWYILMFFVMAGVAMLVYADQHDTIKPILPGVVSLGAAFVLTYAWKDLKGKMLFASLLLVVALAFLAQQQYAPTVFYILTGQVLDIAFVWRWMLLVLVIGNPIMMYVFQKIDD